MTDTLDDDLDLSTFELTEIAFANHKISVPDGLSHYETIVPFDANGTEIQVDVVADLNFETRVLTLTLRAIDPSTGWYPEDPFVGLLYPNDETGRGDGSISYVVRPKLGLPSGTELTNLAIIIFDFNDPIDTPLVLNTLDGGTPASQVLALPDTTTETEIDLIWSGQDEPNGSGITSYDVFVAVDGGGYELLFDDIVETSGTFTGDVGHTYAFYSVAVDNVGHRELPPATADTTTLVTIIAPDPPEVTAVRVSGSVWTASFKNAVDPGMAVGYAIPLGTLQQTTPLPWVNLDQIAIRFSADVEVEQSDLTLRGINTPEYASALADGSFDYDSTTHTATWTLSSPLGVDKLLISIADGDVTDLDGLALDGEWTQGSSDVSGDGVPGGDFEFRFNVLPGDATQNGLVAAEDALTVIGKIISFPGQLTYSPFSDVNGNGLIAADDALLSIGRIISFLPPGDFAVTSAAVAAGSGGGGSAPATATASRLADPEMRSRMSAADMAAAALHARLASRTTVADDLAGLDLYLAFARLDRPAYLDRVGALWFDRGGDLLGTDAIFWREDPRWHTPTRAAVWTGAIQVTEQPDRQQASTEATRWPSSFGRHDYFLAPDESQLELAAADAFFAELENEAES